MRKKKIDYETILACKAGDSDAFERVLVYYDSVINKAASQIITDKYGNKKVVINQEIKENIQQTLRLQIYLKYDHLEEPPPAARSEKANE